MKIELKESIRRLSFLCRLPNIKIDKSLHDKFAVSVYTLIFITLANLNNRCFRTSLLVKAG